MLGVQVRFIFFIEKMNPSFQVNPPCGVGTLYNDIYSNISKVNLAPSIPANLLSLVITYFPPNR